MPFKILEQVTKAEIIAIDKSIRELKRLKRTYGEGRWRKMKATFIIRFNSGEALRAEIHWYECHGKGKKELKIKQIYPK